MSKLKNSVKKGTLWSVIVVIVIALGIVLSAFFGLNAHSSLKDTETLTVTMNTYVYNNQLDLVEAECEKEIGSLKVLYEVKSQMNGDECEIVYVFEKDTDLSEVEDNLKKVFAEKSANGAELEGAFINVYAASQEVKTTLAKGFVLRTVISVVVIAVLAFAYVAIRHSLGMGIASAASAIVGAGLTFAIGVFTRIPATSSYSYVVALGALASLVVSLLTLNKVHANLNEEENVEETVVKCVPVTDIAYLAILVSAAMLIVGVVSIIGAGAFTLTAWFALACIVAMAVTAFVGIIYTPALYVVLKDSVDKKVGSSEKSAYVGAKKTSSKIKKIFAKKEAVEETVDEVVEEPACCCDCDKCEKAEEVAEAEETVEEAEEVVEETTEEETAEEAEEVVEADETTEEAVESEENND